MPSPGFFNENSARAYPCLESTVDLPEDGPLTLRNLPDNIIVDGGFVVGVKSTFDINHTVYLSRIRRQGDFFYFDVDSDAPGLLAATLTFTRHTGDAEYKSEFVDSGSEGLSDSSQSYSTVDACDEPSWWGFLVTGSMEALELLLPSDGVIERGPGGAVFETSLIQNLAESYVSKFGLANDDRTRVDSPDGCEAVVFPYPTGGLRVFAPCILGEVRFKAGYNSTIRQSLQDNSISFGAAVGAGAGQPCEEVPLFPGEVPPAGSQLLEGGPRCNEVLRSFNGVGGKEFLIAAGNGVTITEDPDNHEVVVDVSLHGLAIVLDDISRVSESC